MKINKLVLNNFNSYEGENIFDFRIDDDKKNIILIGGQNGAGKTSLFSAIKIALYGPLTFGYVGVNSYYVQRVKEFINSKAFQKEKVQASVTIDISVAVEREMQDYEITRKWNYTNQKLEEKYFVKKNGELLGEQENTYFQNYLQSIIPPDLFDFFLFDGEEVGNIFTSKHYNNYVKNALFTMCGLDIFELIRKYSSGYISKSNNGKDTVIISEYNSLLKKQAKLEKEIDSYITRKNQLIEQEQINDIELEDLATKFKNSGGITKEENDKLKSDFLKAEKIKADCSLQIRAFMEGLMPFYVVKDFEDKISNQLEYEEKREIYDYVKNKIDKKEIRDTLKKHIDVKADAVDELAKVLLTRFKPKGYSETDEPMHDLSKEEIGRVNAIFSTLDDFKPDKMLEIIKEKQKAAMKTSKINKRIKKSMSEEDINLHNEKEKNLLEAKGNINRELTEKAILIEEKNIALEDVIKKAENKHVEIVEKAQNKHIYELSNGIEAMMEGLLSKKTKSIIEKLERLVVEKLNHIYRKNNLITHIEIDDKFRFNLYQNEIYTENDLLALMINLGNEEFTKLIGNEGKERLFKSCELWTIQAVKKHFESTLSSSEGCLFENDKISDSNSIELYKKIDLSRISNGERQIFILSLYWAIIELSGKNIPFIIDTPYARIDANHRREISEKFFPNISKQVIILSTDEEISEEFYKIIKPFVAKEYLLSNDASENKTTVSNRYFYEV